MRPLLVVIAGPTAAGKTAFAISLAKSLKTEILSADSRQFYREISIGTAKPSQAELESVPHHFINSHSLFEQFNAGDFEKAALSTLDELFLTYPVVIVAGGSGLYLKALLNGLDVFPDIPAEIKTTLEEILKLQGLPALQLMLSELDPEYHASTDLQNHRRIMRALEVSIASGKPYSSFVTGIRPERKFDVLSYCLTPERTVLYHQINSRVDQMIEDGLVKEAETWKDHRDLNALRTVGYTELFEHFDGLCSLDDTIEKIRQNTRRYAKRQLTWFRHQDSYQWIKSGDQELVLSQIRGKLDL